MKETMIKATAIHDRPSDAANELNSMMRELSHENGWSVRESFISAVSERDGELRFYAQAELTRKVRVNSPAA